MCHIIQWNYVFLIGLISSVCLVCCHDKKSLLPQLVDNIVENEIARKVPAVKSVVKKASKRNRLTGSHMKAATDAINKLVDESIVNRVEEAEREVSQMLLKNIEHHIQDAGKIFISPEDKVGSASVADSSTCRDKLDGCDKLAQAGVCKTSRDAMRINCRQTCNYCHIVLDPDMQAKLSKELEAHGNDGKDKVLSIKYHPKVRHKKHHRKHHIGSESVDKLATDEIGMLGEEVTHHDNPSLEHEKTPIVFHHHDHEKDIDEAEKLLATEKKLKEAKELERIKDEANRLLAAHKKAVKQKEMEKQREEAVRLLATEKKIKEEEQKELELDAKAKQERKKHMHKKKKQMVHKVPGKGKKIADDETIPFLDEDPYPLTDFVTEYDKTADTEKQQKVTKNTNDKNDELTKKDKNLETNETETVEEDIKLNKDGDSDTDNEAKNSGEDVIGQSGDDVKQQHTGSQRNDITEDYDDRYSPKHLIMKYHDKIPATHLKNGTMNSRGDVDVDNADTRSDAIHDDMSKKHNMRQPTETSFMEQENVETVSPTMALDRTYNKINNQVTGLDDADIQRHLPMLSEKDVVADKGEKETDNNKVTEEGHETTPPTEHETTPPTGHETSPLTGHETSPPTGHETSPPTTTTSNFVDTNTSKENDKVDMKDEIQTMIDRAFGEVLSSN